MSHENHYVRHVDNQTLIFANLYEKANKFKQGAIQ